MGLLEQLQEQGWYITQPGLEKLLEGDKNVSIANADVKQVVKLALNTDLREYGGGTLSCLTTRGTKVETFDGFGVVQIVKLRNLGAPKVNEESKTAPRLLKLTLTDGQTQYIALEHEHIPSLSINTPPGTKILLKSAPIRIAQGVMLLSDKNVTVLGGHVTALVEKWELSRTMAKYAKGGRLQFSTGGPPPWIPFGQKIQQPTAVNSDKDFKSLQTKDKEESKENTEFNALRNDAIAEATKLGTKKTFGGGAKQMVDANVQKIMDKGFTEEQANHALKLTRNNVDRALSNLQRIEYRKQAHVDAASGAPPSTKPDGLRAGGGKRGFSRREEESELQAKPLGKVSLSDYFGDILQEIEPGTNSASAGKRTSKESTPSDKQTTHRGRSDSAARSEGHRASHSSRSQPHASQNQSSSSGNNSRHNSDGNASYAGGVPNGGGAKSYSQRFENNISSSFANRNTSTGGGSGRGRGRDHGQQGHFSGQSHREQQSSYKQSDYYGSTGSNSRYGRDTANENHSAANHSSGPSNSSGGRSGGGGNSRGNDSKYNQQQQHQSSSGYSDSQQRSERTDRYHNTSSTTTTTTHTNTTTSSNNNNASGGGKHAGGSGKGQSNNSSSYGNSYGSEGRNHQQHHGQQSGHESRSQGGAGSAGKAGAAASGAPAVSNQHLGSSQQHQSSYGNGPKQQNYNQQGAAGSSSSYNATSTTNTQGNSSQQGNGGNNNTAKNASKNNRYGGKDESHKYADGSASSNAPATGTAHSKKGPSKGQQTNAHQSSYGPVSGGGKQTSNADGKMNQLVDLVGGMQIAGSVSNNAKSNAGQAATAHKSGPVKQMVSNHPATVVQQHVPTVASPPGATGMPSSGRGGPSPSSTNPGVGVGMTGPSMPKNFIQLPNGYNYNPYQIMGFQNKQTNEFALNVLKSQQQFDPMQQPPHLGAPTSVSPVGPGVGVPMAATGAPTGVLTPSAAGVISGGPTPGTVGTAGLSMGPGLAPATMTVAYPNWKIGDRCLAKYWEDGGFYQAEITDTSNNTFVVHFLEYGNFEEVLKTDCIPINQAGAPVAAPAAIALSYHPAAAAAHMPPPHQGASVSGPPVQYAPLPAHPQHPHHHHGHVPPHHPPPMGGAPVGYQTATLSDVIGHNAQPPTAHYAPFKPGPPQMSQAMAVPQGQTALPMSQYQPAQMHLHQQQQQQQHHHQQQQSQGHLPQHHHHHHQQMQQSHAQHQQRSGGKFREQRPMYVPPAQRK